MNKFYGIMISLFNRISVGNNFLKLNNKYSKHNKIKVIGENNKIIFDDNSLIRDNSIFISGSNNLIEIKSETSIYGGENQTIYINGDNNHIVIGNNCNIRASSFFIYGNENLIKLEDRISTCLTEFHVEQNSNILEIKNGSTFHGRDYRTITFSLDEGSRIVVGEDCMLSNDIQIRSSDSHSIIDKNGKRINYAKDIIIGNHCWIGLGSIILKGTVIQSNTIVGAGSICNSQYNDSFCIVAGNPGKIVKRNVDWDRKFINE